MCALILFRYERRMGYLFVSRVSDELCLGVLCQCSIIWVVERLSFCCVFRMFVS